MNSAEWAGVAAEEAAGGVAHSYSRSPLRLMQHLAKPNNESQLTHDFTQRGGEKYATRRSNRSAGPGS